MSESKGKGRVTESSGKGHSPSVFTCDGSSSAATVSKVLKPCVNFPPLDDLCESQLYGDMSDRGITFISSVNEVVASYDGEVKYYKRRASEAKGKASELKEKLAKVEEKLAASLEEVGLLKAGNERAMARVAKLKSLRERLVERVDKLERRLRKREEFHEKSLENARREVRTEMTKDFQARVSRMEKGFGDLRKAKVKELHFAETVANLELLEVLNEENAPLIASEIEKVRGWKEEYAAAEGGYDRVAKELWDDFVSPYEPIDSGAPGPSNPNAKEFETEESSDDES